MKKIFHAAKLLLFGHIHKYPKLAFFSSTYCGNPLYTSTEKEHPAYHAGQRTKEGKRANGDSAHRTQRRETEQEKKLVITKRADIETRQV